MFCTFYYYYYLDEQHNSGQTLFKNLNKEKKKKYTVYNIPRTLGSQWCLI